MTKLETLVGQICISYGRMKEQHLFAQGPEPSLAPIVLVPLQDRQRFPLSCALKGRWPTPGRRHYAQPMLLHVQCADILVGSWKALNVSDCAIHARAMCRRRLEGWVGERVLEDGKEMLRWRTINGRRKGITSRRA